MEMPYLNRKFVCSAETAHDAGKVNGGEESEQVKDDNLLLPAAQPQPTSAESGHMAVYPRSERVEDLFYPPYLSYCPMSLFSMMVKLSIRKPCGLLSLWVTFLRRQVVTSDLSVTLLERMMCCRQ